MLTKTRFILAAVMSLSMLACGDDDTTENVPPAKDGGGGGFTDVDAGAKADAGGGEEDAGGDIDGGGSENDGGGQVVDDAGKPVDCNGPKGCYKCAPTTNTQFINQCVGEEITAIPFDNAARIPNYVPGQLPQL